MSKFLYRGLLLFLFPIIRFTQIKSGYSFYGPLQLYNSILAEYFAFFFPLICIFISTVFFTEKIRENFLVYIQPRQPLLTYMKRIIRRNLLIVYSLLFSLCLMMYVFSLYVVPKWNIVKILPAQPLDIMLDTQSGLQPLYEFSPFLYGVLYSMMLAFVGSLISVIALLLLVITKRTLIAFSLPIVTFYALEVIAQLSRFPAISPLNTLFPYYEANSIFSFVGFILVLLASVILLFKRMKDTLYEQY